MSLWLFISLIKNYFVTLLTMLKQYGLRVGDGNHWVVLFPCLLSVHGADWVGA